MSETSQLPPDPTPTVTPRDLLAQQRRDWRSGRGRRAEAYLEEYPSLRDEPEALLDLICNEVLLRQEQGESPQLGEYVERFPDLTEPLKLQFEVDGLIDHAALGTLTHPVGAAGASGARPLPQVIGDYEILGEVGRGGMGVVYKARHRTLRRLAAVKMIITGHLADPEELARFRREAEAVARLAHPNVVQIYDVGEHDGRPYLALELVEGTTLSALLVKGAALPPEETARLLVAVARAVHHAHSQGVIHRDLKPANILLQRSEVRGQRSEVSGERTEDRTHPEGLSDPCPPTSDPLTSDLCPKVSDFGLAKLHARPGATVTETGAFLGTPSYTAPEQAAGQNRDIGPASDVYSLGAIGYELATGRPPFTGASPLDVLVQVRTLDPVPPSRLVPRLPRDLETILLKCLEKDPKRRYPSAEALADDLERFLRGEPIRARPAGTVEIAVKWAKRRPAVAGLLAALVVVTFLGFGGIAWKYEDAVAALAVAKDATGKAKQAEDQARAEQRKAEGRLLQVEMLYHGRTINNAYRAWEESQVATARMMLASTKPEHRGWEHDYVYRLCQGGNAVTLGNHDVAGQCIALSADGKLLASGGFDHTALVLDPSTGDVVQRIKLPDQLVTAVAFHPSGDLLAVGSRDMRIYLYRPRTGEAVGFLNGHKYMVRSLAFLPDGRLVSGAGHLLDPRLAGEVKVWDVTAKKELFSCPGHKGPVVAVAVRPGGKQFASASEGDNIRLWDADRGQPGPVIEHPVSKHTALSYRPDGGWLAAGALDEWTRVYDVETGKLQRTLLTLGGSVQQLAYSPSGRLACAGQSIRVCDPQTGKEIQALRSQDQPPAGLCFSPDSRHLYTVNQDGAVRRWDLGADTEGLELGGHPRLASQVTFRPGSAEVAVCAGDGTVYLWDCRAGRLLRKLEGPGRGVPLAAYHPSGKTLAVAAEATVRLWDLDRDTPTNLPPFKTAVSALAYSHDGSRLAVATNDQAVTVWDTASGAQTARFEAEYPVVHLAFDGGTRLAGTLDPGRVRVWDVASGKELHTIGTEARDILDGAVAWSRDGKKLLTISPTEGLRIWDTGTWELLRRLDAQGRGLAVHPLQDRVAYGGGRRGGICIIDLTTGEEVLFLPTTVGTRSLAFSPDGLRLAACGGGPAARVWSTE